MKVYFKNQYELLMGLTTGDIAFENDEDSRWLVNSICNTCVSQLDGYEVDIFSLFGSSGAWDLDEWCQEVLQFNGWDVDWYDVIAMKIKVNDLKGSVQALHDFPYSSDEVKCFINELLFDWQNKILRYFENQFTKSRVH